MQHLERQQRPRPLVWYDRATGMLYRGHDRAHCGAIGPNAPIEEVLWSAFMGARPAPVKNVRRLIVYMTAGTLAESAPPAAWYKAAALDDWTVEYQHDAPPRRTATYSRTCEDGTVLEIQLRHTSAWFGDATHLPQMIDAYLLLSLWLREQFGAHALMLATPAQTALDALERSLPYQQTYAPLEAPLRAFWRDSAPQARREAPGANFRVLFGKQPGFAVYDARVAYLACLRHVPTWLTTHDEVPDYLPYVPARYRVTFQVPHTWEHVGLLPVKMDGPGMLWEWPNQPGYRFDTYAGGAEVGQALAHGWQVWIRERWLFADDKTPGADPFKTFRAKMTQLLMRCADPLRCGEVGPLVASAIRAMVLHGVGSLARHDTTVTRIVPHTAGTVQLLNTPGSERTVRLTPEGWEVAERLPLSPQRERYAQIHMAHGIWEKNRVRLASQLLRIPYAHLLGCNTDALYTTVDPGWPDDGKVGTYRLKGLIREEIDAPTNAYDLEVLKDAAQESI